MEFLNVPNDRLTAIDLFKGSVDRHPDKPAVIFSLKPWLPARFLTYRDLDQSSDEAAQLLLSYGIRPGDRIALVIPNAPPLVNLMLAAWKIRAAVSVINYLENPNKVVEMVKLIEPNLVVSLDLFENHNAVLTNETLFSRRSISLRDYLPWGLRFLYGKKLPFGKSIDQELREFEPIDGYEYISPLAPRPQDLSVLQHTGGTTENIRLKAAMLSHGNLACNALQALSCVKYHFNEKSVLLCAPPLFHVYGLSVGVNLTFAAGATAVLFIPPQAKNPQKKAELFTKAVVKAIQKNNVTLFPAVPKMLEAMVSYGYGWYGPKDFRPLKLCSSGGDALNQEIKKKFEEMSGVEVIEGYGLSETSPIVSLNPPGRAKPGSLGLLVSGTHWQLAEDGELLIKGSQLMSGYYNDPKATEAAFTEDGFLHTGDVGKIDEDGYGWILGRKKDTIKKGAEQIFPSEIEEVIRRHPAVADAGIVGVRLNGANDDRIVAFVVLKNGATFTQPELVTHCRSARLKSFKIPEELRFLDELPKSAVWKVLRKDLRRIYFESPSK